MQDAKLAKPFGYPYVVTSEETYTIDSRFNIFYYTCANPSCSIILPDLGSVMDSYSVYIKRTDTTTDVLTLYCQVGQTTNVGDSIEISGNEEVYLTANVDQWLVFRGGQLSLQSVRALDVSSTPVVGAIVYNTNSSFMSGTGYYGVNSLGAWFNLSGGGGGGTITTAAPLTGDGSGGNPATLAAGSTNGIVLQYYNGNWVQGQSLSNTTYVDSNNGNDLTGMVGNPLFPFQTIDAAAAALPASIYIRYGSYTTTTNLMPQPINYYFEPGTIIMCTYSGGAQFDATAGGYPFGNIIGGNFIVDDGYFIGTSLNPGDMYVNIESLTCNVNPTNVISVNISGLATIQISTVTIGSSVGSAFIYNYGSCVCSFDQIVINVSVTSLFLFSMDPAATQFTLYCKSVYYNNAEGIWFFYDDSTACVTNLNVGSCYGAGTQLRGVYSINGTGSITSSFASTIFDLFCYEVGNKPLSINDGQHIGPFYAENPVVSGSIQSIPYIEVEGNSSSVMNLNIGLIQNFYVAGFPAATLNIGVYQPPLMGGFSSEFDGGNCAVTIGSIISGNLAQVFNFTNGSVVSINILSPYTDLTSAIIFNVQGTSYLIVTCPSIDCLQLLSTNNSSTTVINVPVIYSNNGFNFIGDSNSLTISNSIIRDASTPFNLPEAGNNIFFQTVTLVSTTGISATFPDTPIYVYGTFSTNTASTNIIFPVISEVVNASII